MGRAVLLKNGGSSHTLFRKWIGLDSLQCVIHEDVVLVLMVMIVLVVAPHMEVEVMVVVGVVVVVVMIVAGIAMIMLSVINSRAPDQNGVSQA